MSNIDITLANGPMGDNATEEDLHAWTAFVAKRIRIAEGFLVTVRAARFVAGSDEPNAITGGDDDEKLDAETAIKDLWDDWCAEGATKGAAK